MADAPETPARPEPSSDSSGEIERLPTQTIGNPSAAAQQPEAITLDGPVAQAAGQASPFAGLLAEANATPGPVPAPRAHRFVVPSGPNDALSAKPIAPPLPSAPPAPRSPNQPTVPLPMPDARARTEVMSPPAPGIPNLDERRIGPYRVLEELGSGGMAIVYKAVQPSLDRIVAIKELRPEYVHDRQIAARFAREAASLATLQHGNIVTIFDYLYDYESAHIVMEFVEGIDLFDLLAATDRVPPEIGAIIATQVAEGLEYAHYRGIVHRDIKPSNILVAKNGEVKVMDFGIARDPGNSELTQVGIAVGTPAYMAPEQIRGDRIDFRTDIFALGIVLYEMLAGEKPWPEEEGRSVTVKVLDEPYKPIRQLLPSVPKELERVIERCLEKDPSARYRTTHELRRDLELYVQRMVPIDPRGRVVLFLRNRNLISEGEASNFVQPELLADAATRRRDQGIPLPPPRALLEPVGIAGAVGFAIILGAAALAAFAPYGQRLPPEPPKMVPASSIAAPPPKEAPVPVRDAPLPEGDAPAPAAAAARAEAGKKALAGDEGFVKVVVEPWARVFVDGDFHDITPFAGAIPLSPGRHRIALRNPYFKGVDRYVEVETGKTQLLKVSLIPRDEGEDAEEQQQPLQR